MSRFGAGDDNQLRSQHAPIGKVSEIGFQRADHTTAQRRIAQRNRGEAEQSSKAFTVPTLVPRGEDDQVVPIADSPLSAKRLKHATLKTYPGYPRGMATTHPDAINADILAFGKA